MLVISGVTAAGKSGLAERLAAMLSAEIINGDMGQCYTPFSIGTAKPNWRNSSIPHHLFDIIDEPRNLTVVEYYQKVQQKLVDIWQRNCLPIIVGGSSFYLSSLFFPPKKAAQQSSVFIKEDDHVKEDDHEKLWQQLYEIDEARALQIGRFDTYRLKRALEIWHTTGERPSMYVPTYNPICNNFRFIFCIRERKELHYRINKRVKEMIDAGWIQEVQELMGTEWEFFLQRKKIIGYNDILLFLHQQNQSDKEREKMIHMISKRTRQYAKRQLTFWRMLCKRLQQHDPHNTIETINLSHIKIDDYLVSLVQELAVEIDI